MSAQSRVFDPGISTESDDETELLLDSVGDILKGQVDRPLSFREGEFQVEGVPVKLFKVLFNTGALHKSYISANLVENHRNSWKFCIFPHQAVACLEDQATRIETTEVVRGVLSFVSGDGRIEYKREVEAIVWNMPEMDFILGQPDIVRIFVELLTSMLRVSQDEVNSTALASDMLLRRWVRMVSSELPGLCALKGLMTRLIVSRLQSPPHTVLERR